MSVLKIKDAGGNWQDIPTINGSDATINGLNTLNIVGGTNIDIDQEGTTLTINSTGSSGEWGTITGDISDQTDLFTILSQKAEKEELGAVKLIGTEENPIILNDLEKGFYIIDGDVLYSINDQDQDGAHYDWFNNIPVYVLVHNEYRDGSHRTILLRPIYNDDFPDRILYLETINDFPNEEGEFYENVKVITEKDLSKLDRLIDQEVYNILDQAVLDNYLLSSDNVKTINNQSIIGSGNIEIEGGSSEWGLITGTLSNQTDLQNALNTKANTNDIPTKTSDLNNDSGFITSSYHDSTKQDTLVSGTNIKTINNQSLLGNGNIEIESGVPDVVIRPYLSGYSYEEGSIVIKDDVLYQAVQDIPYDEEFNPNHWSNVKPCLSDIISDLSKDITNTLKYKYKAYRGDNETTEFGFLYSYYAFRGNIPNVSIFYIPDITNPQYELVMANTKISFNANGVRISVELDEPLSETEGLIIAASYIE